MDKSRPISPDPILQTASAFMASKHMFVASELGLFESLAGGPASLELISERIGIPRRTLRALADAMVAIGLLIRIGDEYGNSPAAQEFLAGPSDAGLRPFLRFWNEIAYPRWIKLDQAIRSGKPVFGGLNFTPEEQEIFSFGVESFTKSTTKALASLYDFGGHNNILDLGGGTGSFLITLLERFPHLKGTLYESPAVIPMAERRLQSTDLRERIHLVKGDFFKDPIPAGHDVLLVANVLHSFSPEQNMRLLRRIHRSADKGTRLLLIDFWTDSTHTQPPFSAMIVGEFFLYTGLGDVYSVEEVNGWLNQTGWESLRNLTLSGPEVLIVAAPKHL